MRRTRVRIREDGERAERRSEHDRRGEFEERFVGGIGDDVFLHDQLDASARK